jgi:hypothetical protein
MNHTENISFIRAQLTIASWYVDRAAHADEETASRYLHQARQACDIVMQLLPNLTPDEEGQSVHRELTALRDRLRAGESGSWRTDGQGTPWGSPPPDSSP